jgi:hypothetical protein
MYHVHLVRLVKEFFQPSRDDSMDLNKIAMPLLLACLLQGFPDYVSTQSPEVIGRVLQTEGNVTATDAKGIPAS